MIPIALAVILFIKKTQSDTDEHCADLLLSLSPMPFPSQILATGLAQPFRGHEHRKIESGFTQAAQNKVQRPAKAGKQQDGKGSSLGLSALRQGAPLKLLPGCKGMTCGWGDEV